ncbi:MAG: ABC-F family ATP-binding cassette domain-containing protein [Gemmatimonadetes bacterium]|nr:ABC-F family ATP-binding cassette domain-containing protein [Gemmatimonadota bacterium]
MISASNLAKSFGDRTLFSGVSLQLNAGERYGLVGANGSGKTTLLRILSNDLEASEGTVSVAKRLRIGVLSQDQFIHENHAILDVALMGNPELWRAIVEKEAIIVKADTHFDADRFAELEEIVQRHDGYAAEARAATILEGLGIPTQVHRDPMSTLSGGFKLRVLLAQVLASAPDILLLDEPTNHLDIISIRWLEIFMRDFAGLLVVVSHDHRFLDNITTIILDVDYETVLSYRGNYSAFLEAKRTERERRVKDITARKREIAHHQKFVDRFRAKASKARQAQSRVRLIEKKADALEELPESSRRYPTFRFEPRRDSGRDVLTIKGVKKAFGENAVLHGVDLLVQRGERLAIIGPNGIGKSTLLKIVMGEETADAGSVEWGYETHLGYFAQNCQEQFKTLSGTAEEWVWNFCPGKDIGFVRGRMARMLFSGDDVKKRLKALSGGEATRLIFSRLTIERPNVLVLDEPTNHLDLESIEALVEGLKSYPGTLILVSHDRWFVAQFATRIVEIKSDGIRDYPGTYEEYVHACGDDHLDVDTVILKVKREKQKKDSTDTSAQGGRDRKSASQRGNSRAVRRRLQERQAGLTTRIEAAEARVKKIDAMFCGANYFEHTPPAEVRKAEAERNGLEREVSDLMAEWEQVGEEMDG